MRWCNWSGLVCGDPYNRVDVASENEIVDTIRSAVRDLNKIRPCGTGHSCSPICATDGVLMSFGGLQGIVEIDSVLRRARIRAGTVIKDIGEPLCQAGLALENQGDIDVQTMAGAISTGTHGTGVQLDSMSSKLVELRLALASGDVILLTREHQQRLFDSAAVSFGSLGVFVEITIELVERYLLRESNWVLDVEQCLEEFPRLQKRHRNIEFYWLPAFDQCVLKAFDKTNTPLTLEDEMDSELAAPGTIERYLRPDRVHWSHRIYPSRRTRLFNEMEFAVPLERGLECFSELRTMMKTRFQHVTWAVEYRPLASDNAYLSQAYSRTSACISVHEDATRNPNPFFSAVQAVFLNYDGRPHWGKTHYCTAPQLQSLYPQWNEFLDVRHELDPQGLFLNDHLYQILGLPQ